MNVAGGNATGTKGKAEGFDNHLAEEPSLVSGKQSTHGSAKQSCLGVLGLDNSASSSPDAGKVTGSGTDRSKAVSSEDDPKCRAHESDDGDIEYSPHYKRARRQLWIWRIVSYVLIAAVIGASQYILQDALAVASLAVGAFGRCSMP